MTKEQLANEIHKTLNYNKDSYMLALDALSKNCKSFADSNERFELMQELDFWNHAAISAVDAYDRFDKLLNSASNKCGELDPAAETFLLNALRVSFRTAQRLTLDSLALNKMLEEGGSLDDIQI